jgi:hypothetical protein
MAHRSRWGWHPCDYATFLLLRRLHRLYWEAVRQYAAWRRWRAKRPHNRVIRRRLVDGKGNKVGTEVVGPRPEPPLPPLFCTRRQVLTHWSEEGRPLKKGRLVEEVVFDDWGVPEAYRAARSPAPTEEEVTPLRLTGEEIRQLAARTDEEASGR